VSREPVASQAHVARFITIPLSHYCEKARWALDRAGLPYREEPHAPLFSRFAGGTVPSLVHDGRRFTESTGILVFADGFAGGDVLYPREPALRSEVDALVARFDAELGPHARRWAYSHLLSNAALLRSVWARDVPRLEASLVPVIAPFARFFARRAYNITPQSAQRSLDRVRGVFKDIEPMLRDGRGFLVGERFTAADLTFAALAAPVVFPAGCRASHPALEDVPAAMREEILRFRNTGAGQLALRLFERERQVIRTAPGL
jgi:glutathione S-transferase